MKRKKIKKVLAQQRILDSQIEDAIKDLYYISETDSELFLYAGEKAEEVTAEILLNQIGRKDQVEERAFEDFFKRLTENQEWFGDEEIETANRFSALKEILTKNLSQLKVFKIGTIEVDIYIVGLDAEHFIKGVWTKAVET